jgi:Arc/MetJ family transcription regulator
MMAGTFTLSKPMQKFIADQVQARGLKDEKAFVTQLLKEEQLRIGRQQLLAKLDEGRASGVQDLTDDFWVECEAKVVEHFARKKPTRRRASA